MSSKNKTTAKTDEVKRALVPKLRFPEFQETEGWMSEAGDSLFDQINDRNPESDLPVLAVTQEHGAVPRNLIDYHVSVTEKSIESYKVVRVGDFIISLRSFQGGIEYSSYHGICSPAYVILRRRGEGSDEYFRHYLKTDRFIRILTKNLEGLRDGKMISYAQFSKLMLPVPKPAEQQKIAECLSSVDALIAAQAQEVDALKAYKKTLMQQLFPLKGETQPRLRFPEFQNAGEWEMKRLSSVVQLISGMHLSPDQYSTTGEVPYFTGPSDFTNDIESITKWTKRSTNMAARDDTLITVKGSGVGEVWYSHLQAVALGRQLMAIRAKQSSSQFIFQFLLTKKTRFEDLGSGNLIPGLSRVDILDMEAYFPSPAEQKRIASCLSSLDTLITAEAQKLEALKTHKKGLMQQLFPLPYKVDA